MKKIIWLFTIAMLAGVYVYAQENTGTPAIQHAKKFFVSLSGGPTFPVSDFASKDSANTDAGFAKTGYNINLHAGYQLAPYVGIISSFQYAYYKMDLGDFANEGVSTDHWQYYGIMIGPMFTAPLGEKAKLDFKVLGGLGRVNSPKISTRYSSVYVDEGWSNTFLMNVGADVRYNVGKTVYLLGNVDYSYMKPKFDVKVVGGDGTVPHKFQQKISVINLNVGVGINF